MQRRHTDPISFSGGHGAPVSLFRKPLSCLPDYLAGRQERWFIVVDAGWPGAAAFTQFRSSLVPILWKGGEECKTRANKASLEDQLLSSGIEPSHGLCAVGGGALLDLVGFVASTLFRGVPLILAPTTLLSLVDASIGSKNGINLPQGKNLIGTLYDPQAVWWDESLIQEMPLHLIRQGIAEMLKHAVLLAPHQIQELSTLGKSVFGGGARYSIESSLLRDLPDGLIVANKIADLAFESVSIKHMFVRWSLKTPECRHALNFGHTIGHALEAASRFTISHGDAVAMGLLVEGLLAQHLGLITQETLTHLKDALEAWLFPFQWLEWEQLLPFLIRDKKSENGGCRVALPAPCFSKDSSTEFSSYKRTSVEPGQLAEVYQLCQSVYV